MNYFDQNPNQDEEEAFDDKPEEIEGEYDKHTGAWVPKTAPVAEVVVPKVQRPTVPTVQLESQVEEDVEEQEEEPSEVISDARFRLEQGRLYEMVLQHDLFAGIDADKKAIKSVQDEIRAYAQERMEIMLGMKAEQNKEVNAFPMESFPFNSLEVEALKSLAAAATKGASRDAAPFDAGQEPAVPRTTLNPIGKSKAPVKQAVKAKPLPKAPISPVKRQKVDGAIQRILAEEGVTMDQINEVFDPNKKPLTPEDMAALTEAQIIERNRQATLRNRQAANPQAIPMPSAEQIEMMVTARANAAAAHPQMQKIMGLLAEADKRKGT
jgi:hypothetical protein